MAISLGLKWGGRFGRRVGNRYPVGQYSSDLPNVAGDGIRWHGMPFASLPLDCYIVLSKSFLWMDNMPCLQIAVTGVCLCFLPLAIPNQLGMFGHAGRLVCWLESDSILGSSLFCVRAWIAKKLGRARVLCLCSKWRLCPSYN